MLRKMLGKKRLEEEELEEYMVRTSRAIKYLKTEHGVEDWDEIAIRHHFGWAGYVSRRGNERLTYRVLRYRDRSWLARVEAENQGRQLHCRILRVWRWETPLVKYGNAHEADWHELALDKRKWLRELGDMARWSKHHRA